MPMDKGYKDIEPERNPGEKQLDPRKDRVLEKAEEKFWKNGSIL